MIYTLSVAPTVEPLSLAETKSFLRVEDNANDGHIEAMISAARTQVENLTGRALINQTWKAYLDEFVSEFELRHAPLSSVTSIAYVDTDGAAQTATSTLYTVDTDSEPGRVYLAYDQSWPSTRSVEKAVTVTYVAGYGAAGSSVPAPLKQAMRMLVAHWYENREPVAFGVPQSIPMTVQYLIIPYKVYTW